MSDRGMKKWNAYKSLPEHDVSLLENARNKEKVEKPLISSEEAELINEILVNYQGEELTLTYYKDGYIYDVDIYIKKIDQYNRKIITTEGDKYLFNQIVGLKRKR